jgi:hypothetical protein
MVSAALVRVAVWVWELEVSELELGSAQGLAWVEVVVVWASLQSNRSSDCMW